MNEDDTRDSRVLATANLKASRLTEAKNQLAENNLEYALETILREAGSASFPDVKEQKQPDVARSDTSQPKAYSVTPNQSEDSPQAKNHKNKLDDALDFLLKDAKTQAQNARTDGTLSRSGGPDPAAERREALQAAARRRAALEQADSTAASDMPNKKPFWERIDPKTARILMVLPLVFVIGFLLWFILVLPVKESVTIEAGDKVPDVSAYAWFLWQRIRYATSEETATYLKSHGNLTNQVDTSLPGRYTVFIRVGFMTYHRNLIVADTTPPVITGETEKTAYIGIPFSYRQGINITDNASAPVTLTVDAAAVDLQTPGDYPVIYSATDSTGNTASIEGNIHVTVAPKPSQSAEEAELEELAEEVIDAVITPEMTYAQKARAVYDWVQQSVTFRETNQGKDNVTGNALQALKSHDGDCHVFAAVSEVLLTAADIPNRRIENKIGGNVHEWNLINLGEGWHHFDTVIAQGVPAGSLFNLTNAELDERATRKGFIHDFDAAAYPPIE